MAKLHLKLTENGVAVGSQDQGFVELRLTKDGVVHSKLSSSNAAQPEIELTEKGVIIRDNASTPKFQELTLTKDGLIKAGPGNS